MIEHALCRVVHFSKLCHRVPIEAVLATPKPYCWTLLADLDIQISWSLLSGGFFRWTLPMFDIIISSSSIPNGTVRRWRNDHIWRSSEYFKRSATWLSSAHPVRRHLAEMSLRNLSLPKARAQNAMWIKHFCIVRINSLALEQKFLQWQISFLAVGELVKSIALTHAEVWFDIVKRK